MQSLEPERGDQVEYKPWCPSSLIDSFDDHHISGEEEMEPEHEEGGEEIFQENYERWKLRYEREKDEEKRAKDQLFFKFSEN